MIARASNRLATFAQAISSTPNTATSMAQRTVTICDGMYASVYGRTATPTPAFVSGYSCSSRRAIVASSAAAPSRVAPAASRPNTSSRVASPRSVAAGSKASGNHTRLSNGNRKPSGITPITVWGVPFARTTVPTMSGSAAYRFSHTSRLSTIVGGAPGRSSPSRKPRPTIGRAPACAKVFHVTNEPRNRSGRCSASARFTVPEYSAASPSNVVCWSRQSR